MVIACTTPPQVGASKTSAGSSLEQWVVSLSKCAKIVVGRLGCLVWLSLLSAQFWLGRALVTEVSGRGDTLRLSVTVDWPPVVGALVLLGLHQMLPRHQNSVEVPGPVPVWRRLVSFHFDCAFALAVFMPVAGVPFILLRGFQTGIWSGHFFNIPVTTRELVVLQGVGWLCAGWIFFVFAWPLWRRQQSVGHAVMGYRVVSADGAPSLGRVLLHTLFGLLVLNLWYLALPAAMKNDRHFFAHEDVNRFFPVLTATAEGGESP